ncbi:unnamed protein product [Macrosiphum euphorbiae]|uniref:Uncharacterized protein n=1 Tax=Macrosiphum euphorbiae TaxID=13131 RepID=A0AAV0W482_9HEMI|nr:unnamed protein product [Macrosiphum euphorbiae]
MSTRNQSTNSSSNSNGDFNLSVEDYRPNRGTVADVVKLILDQVSLSLLNARRLAGLSSGIPTWEDLMAVWRRHGRTQVRAERGTQTSPTTTPTAELPTRSERTPEAKPVDGRALAKWAVEATHQELMAHPLIQIALDRGVVRRPPARHPEPRRLTRKPPTVDTRNTRVVGTKADLKQRGTRRDEPTVADLINLDTDEEEFLQLRVGAQELPDVDMLSGLPDSDDETIFVLSALQPITTDCNN